MQLIDDQRAAAFAGQGRPARIHDRDDVADAVVQGHAARRPRLADLVAYLLSLKGQYDHDATNDWRSAGASSSLAARAVAAASQAPGHVRAPGERGEGAAELADLLGQLLQPALQPARPDHAGQRQEPEAEMGVSGAGRRATGRRRRWSSTASCISRSGSNDVVALDAKTGRVFWIYRYTPAADAHRLLRREQSRPRDSRRHAVHGHARRAPDRDRREDRPAAVEDAKWPRPRPGYSMTLAPLVVKDKVIVGVGGGEYGIRGFIAAYDARDRQGGVALLHDSRPRRAGPRDLGAVSAEPDDVLRSRGVEARRRVDLGDRLVRSRS